jgi:hypothetical protein
MDKKNKSHCSRREFTAAAVSTAAFTIVPRRVLGGPGFTPPSDKINLGVIGLGRQGMVVIWLRVRRKALSFHPAGVPTEFYQRVPAS